MSEFELLSSVSQLTPREHQEERHFEHSLTFFAGELQVNCDYEMSQDFIITQKNYEELQLNSSTSF